MSGSPSSPSSRIPASSQNIPSSFHAQQEQRQQIQHHEQVTGDYGLFDDNDYRHSNITPKNVKEQQGPIEVNDARPILPNAAFFMGDLRDGLPMINMQSSFLMSCKNFTEKDIGLIFFVFGISQVIFMAPAGYFIDYAKNKITMVLYASAAISALTVLTALLAREDAENMTLMLIIHFIQGGVTCLLPSGFNAITLGIVGSTGFTHQVSRNKMMNHIGTALTVSIASSVAYLLYPNIGLLFIVSPLACAGLYYYMRMIRPEHVDTDAARGLIVRSPTMTEYETMDEKNEVNHIMSIAHENDDDDYSDITSGGESSSEGPNQQQQPETFIQKMSNSTSNSVKSLSSNVSKRICQGPSYIFGLLESASGSFHESQRPRASTPLTVLKNPTFVLFTSIVFLFHTANSSVLPLVMQSLAVDDPKKGILLSGLCILIGQSFMMVFAKICGDYSPMWGRKNLFLAGLFSLPLRCYLLVIFLNIKEGGLVNTEEGENILKALILSTQFLDAVGAGILGTLYILVTNDISGGTGRFSLMLGMTTGATCLGGTISGYIGQALAQDYGYSTAIGILGILSLLPAFLYLIWMPETLPDYAREEPEKKKKKRRKLIGMIMKKLRRTKKMDSALGAPLSDAGYCEATPQHCHMELI